MVMRRDGGADMGLKILGREFADPIRHPISRPSQPTDPETDPYAALMAAINTLSAKMDGLKDAIGGGSSGIVSVGQAVQFITLDLTSAHTLREITVPAYYSYCVVFCDGGTQGISVRLRDHSGDVIDLGRFDGFPVLSDTNKIYVTNDVRSGRSTLVLGFTYGEPLRLATQGQIATKELYNVAIAAAGTFQSTWFNYTSGRLLIDVVSTLDQACTIQLVGNIDDDYTTAKNMGAALNCPIGSVITSGLDVGLAFDDWHPYIGVVITTAVAPLAGSLVINAVQLADGGR